MTLTQVILDIFTDPARTIHVLDSLVSRALAA